MQWTITGTTDGDAPSVEMTLLPNDYSRSMWNYDFKVTQTITLADGKLTATMVVTNPGDKEFTFTGSFHTYFAAAIDEVKVTGLEGLTEFDRLSNKESPCHGPVIFDRPVDSVYAGAPSKLSVEVGNGKTIGISSTGWSDAVVWTPWTDMQACYKEFVCVENAACSPVAVAPGASWTGSMTLAA